MSDTKREKNFIYKNNIKWTEQRKGVLSSIGKPNIETATPPEFKGHPNIWSPEDLFVSAVNSCIMTTFLYYADSKKLDFISYESEVEGILEFIDMKLIFTEIKVYPKIIVKSNEDIDKAKKYIENAEKNCLISNSIKSKVSVIPVISVDK